jgi:hypothetical protein
MSKLRLAVPFLALLVAVIAGVGVPTYDELHEETAEERVDRILAECGYMFNVGTSGGAETMEEFQQ